MAEWKNLDTLASFQSLAAAGKKVDLTREMAGEGGPWGMAVLASYLVNGKGKALDAWLNENVFASSKKTTVEAKLEAFKKQFLG